MSADEKQTVQEMIGDVLREAGTLLLVFVPVDLLLELKAMSWRRFWIFVMIGLFCVIVGIWTEASRKL